MQLSEIASIVERLSPYALLELRRSRGSVVLVMGHPPKGSRLASISIALSEDEMAEAHDARMIVEYRVRAAVQEMNRHLADAA